MSDDSNMTIREVAPLLRGRKLSPVELTRETLARIGRENARLNAYLTVLEESALREAREAERAIMAGEYHGPLHGVPVSVKDLFYTRGQRTTAGSKIYADFVPGYDAAAVQRLRAAGAVLLGKTNMHELAYGITNNNPHYGPARNPADTTRIPGGSSGGSAAAVAAGLCFASLGTDTGGSIRIPASLCGVVGLKPTFGRVSRWGVIELGWTQDHVGPLARTAWDAAVVLQAVAGHDPRDSHSAEVPAPDFLEGIDAGVEGLRVGVPQNYFFERLAPEVEAAVRGAIRALEQMKAQVRPVRVESISEATEASRLTLLAEAAALYSEELRRRPLDFGADVRALLEQGQALPAADYVNAQRLRARFRAELDELFRQVDVLITATTPTVAPAIGQAAVSIGGAEEDVRLASTRLVRAFNFAGIPAVSVPCGVSSDGLPIGLHIAGRAFDEATVLRVAHACGSVGSTQ
jgi:aspartyl-tRNA(Asn)/glutamyl-tRNA(Gln) amidotransferase subunit A